MILHILNQSTIFWVKLYIDKLLFLGNKIVSDNGGEQIFARTGCFYRIFLWERNTLILSGVSISKTNVLAVLDIYSKV